MEDTITDAPPDLELLEAVEADMVRVEQALVDLNDESKDPAEITAWLPEVLAETAPDADAESAAGSASAESSARA